jgi:hypothetical protein
VWQGQGFSMLEQVSNGELGGELVLVEQYKRAVFCRAMALMVPVFATLNRREAGENLAKEGDSTQQGFLADSSRALRNLLDLTENVSVALL